MMNPYRCRGLPTNGCAIAVPIPISSAKLATFDTDAMNAAAGAGAPS